MGRSAIAIHVVNPRGLCKKLEKQIGHMFRNLYNFTIMCESKIAHKIRPIVQRANIPESKWLTATAASIRKCYLTQHCMYRHSGVRESDTVKHIIQDIKNGKNIIDMSHKYKFNPIGLLKVFLEHYSLPQSALKTSNLKPQHERAQKMDIFRPNQDTLLKSQQYEQHVQNWLDQHDIQYYTQEQLIEQNSRLTPDFLLKSPITINNQTIHWIDAKNFYGAMVPYILRSLKKQSAKYNDVFGPGAFVFSLGYTTELAIPHCLVLDDVDQWTVE